MRKIPPFLRLAACTLLLPLLPLAQEPPHPILTISGSGSGADSILSTWTEAQYTNNFVPHQSPRNDSYGFVPPVVSGDTDWSWSPSAPDQITSKPSGIVFPNANPAYPIQTQAVTVMSGNTVNVPYYLKAGSSSSKSLVFALIDYNKRSQLRTDLNKLAPAYMNSGSTHAARNQNYARRIAIALLDWARWFPDYYMTAKNSASFINTSPSYILSSDLQRASDHNGLAHEWADDELLAFDAIYDSPALSSLSAELGFDVRAYIKTNLYCNEGDFIVYHVPVNVAIQSNLSGPYTVLALVARVLNRPDYILWMDDYLDATVTRKIRRDGTLSEGMGYSIGYINENLSGARNTRDYFLSRPADTPELQAIRIRATNYAKILEYGQARWATVALPNGQLPSFGDTPFNTYFTARNSGNSALLPAYGTVSLGAGSGSQAVQLNQNFSGDNNHMRSDTTAFVLWAFNNELLGNIRYHNGTAGRQFTEQILAYNAVTIDRTDMSSPDADTYGNGDLTLYEAGNNGLAVTEIDGQRAYFNKASRYQRILLLNSVDLNRPYVVDVFRVTGGATHDYVLHGSIRFDQTWECSFPLVTNPAPYPMLEGTEVWVEPMDSGDSFPYYGFWRNVSSNQAPGNFQITYRDTSASNRDLRLWMTDDGTAKVYLGMTPVPARANGEPVNYWVNNLWRPSAIIRKRIPSGTLQDLFVSVIEPLNNGLSTIQSVERLPMTGSSLESCALKITFTDGRIDTCLVNLRNPQVAGATVGSQTISTTDGQYVLNGRIGVHMDRPSGARVWTVNAGDFQYADRRLIAPNLYYSGLIAGETRKLTGGSNDAFITTTPLPLGTALRNEQLSLTFGALSGTGTTGISELFQIDQVLLTNGQYCITFTNDHMLEITNGATSVEQMAPQRTFTGTNQFEIALSASAVPITGLADLFLPTNATAGPLPFTLGALGSTPADQLQVTATSSNPTLVPPAGLLLGGAGANRTLTITPAPGQTGLALITVSSTDGAWTSSRSFTLNVAATNPPPVQPVYFDADIGGVSPPGSSSRLNDTFTLSGGGNDIWGTADQFHFTYLPVTNAYCQVVARVATLDPVNSWTKCGVMLRESLDAGARHAMTVITPSNGVNFMYRPSTGGSMSYTKVSGQTVPIYLKIVRADTSFTSWYAPYGTNWTQIGSAQTIPMTNIIFAGLALSSHVVGTLVTATIDHVAITPLAQPLLSASVLNGQFRLQVSGDLGPTYLLQSSTNLAAWSTLLTTNPPTLPFTWTDPGPTLPARFYRVLLGP